MSTWREEYFAVLKQRDKHEHERVDYDLIDAYTRLADRTAALEAGKTAVIAGSTTSSANTTAKGAAKPPSPVSNNDRSAQLKSDLAEALRAKGQFQSRLQIAERELEKLRVKSQTDSKLLRELTAERSLLVTKVRDRDEELRGKAKLVEEVQDEMLSLNLQVNIAEQRSKKLQLENKDLVDRWMARMGKEADAMNEASKFS